MELQETRRYILEILRERGECTVDQIVQALTQKLDRSITTVTVRHHLDRLRAEDLVKSPEIRRRNAPGRPQYTYTLTAKAAEYFPNNYAGFADRLLREMKQHLPSAQINVILEDMASHMAGEAAISAHLPLEQRLQQVVSHLNEQGYCAEYESAEGGFLLVTTNCPYDRLSSNHAEVCTFDLQLVSSMLGIVPRFMGNLREGNHACQYFIPQPETV